MKPEDEIKKIVQENKLLDCAEVSDLVLIRDAFQPKANNPGIFDERMRAKSDTDSRRKYDVLVKILGWIK